MVSGVGQAVSPQLAGNGQGEVLAIWALGNGEDYIVEAAARGAEGPWQDPVALSASMGVAFHPTVALDASGDAIAAWDSENRAMGTAVVEAAVRMPEGVWTAPVQLGSLDGSDPAMAIDAQGDALVVWEANDDAGDTSIQAAEYVAGAGWGPPVDLASGGNGADGPVLTEPQVAMDSNGDAAAVWTSFEGMEGIRNVHNMTIQAAALTAGSDWQGPVDLVSPGEGADIPNVVVDQRGDAVAVWQGSNDGDRVVEAASLPKGGTWQPPIQLSANEALANGPRVGLDEEGDAVVVWRAAGGASPTGHQEFSTLPVGGGWQPPLDLPVAIDGAAITDSARDTHGDVVAVRTSGATGWEGLTVPGAGEEAFVSVAEGMAVAIWSGGTGVAAALYEPGEPPVPETVAASSLTRGSATLEGSVNANDVPIDECHFEYGPTISYGMSVPCASSLGGFVSAAVSGLQQNTVYHYRLVARSAAGTGKGADRSFVTSGPPEYGRCLELPPEKRGKVRVYHGAFSNSGCTAADAADAGKYEWYSGIAKPRFTLKAGETILESTTKVRIACTGMTGLGEYAGVRTMKALRLQLEGCEASGHQCSAPGFPSGTVQTASLEGAIGWEAQVESKVALDLYPAGGAGPVMEYTCTGSPAVVVSGSLMVPVSSDKMLVSSTVKYKAVKGRQVPEGFEGAQSDILTESIGGGTPTQLGMTSRARIANEEAAEINTHF